MTEHLDEISAVQGEADCLFDEQAVRLAMEAMVEQINAELADQDVLVLPIMNGGIVPAGMMIPGLRFPMELDYLHATRYRGATSGAELHWLHYPQTSLQGRVVLLIDDIYDEGLTLASIRQWCLEQSAAAVYTAVLFEKQHDRNIGGISPDFVALSLPDRYVYGFGMDYKHYLRNAAGVFAVKGL